MSMEQKAEQYAKGDEALKQAYQQGYIQGQSDLDDILRKIHDAQAQSDLDVVNDAIEQYESMFNPVVGVS